jgi:hypothetical protein
MSKDAVPHILRLGREAIESVLQDIDNEIARQDKLARLGTFGGTHILPGGPDPDRLAVLMEEVGEVAEELNEIKMGLGERGRVFDELVQVAAVAAAWAAAILEGRP